MAAILQTTFSTSNETVLILEQNFISKYFNDSIDENSPLFWVVACHQT